MKVWRASTFQGLGAKKQKYLDSLTEEMVKWGFQPLDKSDGGGVLNEWVKGRDLLFISPDGNRISIRAITVNDNLRSGFAYEIDRAKGWRTRAGFIATVILDSLITALLALILKYILPSADPTLLSLAILMPVFILFLIILFYVFVGKSERSWKRRLKRLMIETAESMGAKQITPFKKTTVELED